MIEQPVPFYQRKSWLGYGLAIVLVSMIVRIGLARLPAVVTNDSLDYILASYAIAHHLDFFTASLRDWRMPGYPIFLAGLQSAVAFTSQNVALGQKMVGILGVVLSFIMAGQLNSRVVFILLPLFLGLNPAYLFDEHLVMTEGLTIFALLLFLTVGISCFNGRINLVSGTLLGISLGAAILTRANTFVFGGVFVLTLIGFNISCFKDKLFNHKDVRVINFFVGLIGVLFLLVGPWIWRNYTFLGAVSPFSYNTNRAMIVHLIGHHLFDPTQPLTEKYLANYIPDQPQTIHNLLENLGQNSREAESLARQIVQEQLENQPQRYIVEVISSVLYFGGLPPLTPIVYARADNFWWFEGLLIDVDLIQSNGQNFQYRPSNFVYIANSDGNNWINELWSSLGSKYFRKGRPFIYVLFFLALVVFSFKFRANPNSVRQDKVIIALSLSYLGTVLLHSLTLADLDRYTHVFDWVPILILGLVAEKFSRNLNNGN